MAASQDIGGYDVTDGASILNEAGLSIDDNMRTVELGPGDVALWTPFTVHGGCINTTESEERRFYINGYAKACNCDRGHSHLVFNCFLNVHINNLCLGRRATATRRASANSNRGLCSKGALLHVGREALSHPGLIKTSLPLR